MKNKLLLQSSVLCREMFSNENFWLTIGWDHSSGCLTMAQQLLRTVYFWSKVMTFIKFVAKLLVSARMY